MIKYKKYSEVIPNSPSFPSRQSVKEKIANKAINITATVTMGFSKPEKNILRLSNIVSLNNLKFRHFRFQCFHENYPGQRRIYQRVKV